LEDELHKYKVDLAARDVAILDLKQQVASRDEEVTELLEQVVMHSWSTRWCLYKEGCDLRGSVMV
jgi:hypothetical protein